MGGREDRVVGGSARWSRKGGREREGRIGEGEGRLGERKRGRKMET